MKEVFGIPKPPYEKSPIDDPVHGKEIDHAVNEVATGLAQQLESVRAGELSRDEIQAEFPADGSVSKEEIGAHFAMLRMNDREAIRKQKALENQTTGIVENNARRLRAMDAEVREASDKHRAYLEAEWCKKNEKDRETLNGDEREECERAIAVPLADYETKKRMAIQNTSTYKLQRRIGEAELSKLERDKTELKESPEAFYALHARDLTRYVYELNRRGGLAETPYVQMKKQELLENVRAGIPTLIEGDLGSGKTELAISLCEKELGIKDPYILSLQKDTDPSELYGKTVITVTGAHRDGEIEKLQRANQARTERQFASWKDEHQEATPTDEDRAWDLIVAQNKTLFDKEVDRNVVTKFMEGQIYRAMQEGKPVIIDEFNAAPHSLLISLNHLLTRRVGDTIRMQQDSNEMITIKEGFSFILTGNMGDRYSAHREKADAAFLSRLTKIEYDYLPQTAEGTYDKYLEAQKEAHEKGASLEMDHELFDLLVSMTLTPSLTSDLTPAEFRQLWNLAVSARVLQENFAGKETDVTKSAGGTANYRLKKTVPSIRNLKKVIDAWKKDDYQFPLDYHLYDQFISQAMEGADRAFLFSEFSKNGFFTDREAFKFSDEELTMRNGGAEALNPNFSCNVDAFKKRGSAVRDRYIQKNVDRKLEGGARYVVDHVYGEMPLRTIGVPKSEGGDTPNVLEGAPFDPENILRDAEGAFDSFKDILRGLEKVRGRASC